jgi:hypothetical protein
LLRGLHYQLNTRHSGEEEQEQQQGKGQRVSTIGVCHCCHMSSQHCVPAVGRQYMRSTCAGTAGRQPFQQCPETCWGMPHQPVRLH